MATVIDELLVTLGLDSSKFKTEANQTQTTINRVGAGAVKQSKELEDSLKKHQTETTKRLKQVGEVGQSTYQNFNKLRLEVMALFSVLATGYGLQDFIKNVTTGEVGLGRLSTIAGVSVQSLDAFGQATERMGGDAKASQQALAGFAQALETMSLTGKPASFLPTLNLMGIDISGVMKHLPGAMEKVWKDINKWMIANPGPTGFNRLNELGLGGAYPILGAPNMQEQLDKARKTATTPEDVKKGAEFVENLQTLEQTLYKLGQTIVNDFVPDIDLVLKDMTKWIDTNKDWIKADIEETIKKTINYIKNFLAAVKDVATAVGGWKDATELVLGIWAGFKFLPIVSALASMAASMSALGVSSGVVSGFFAALAGPAGIILAAVGALGGMIWDDERIKKHNKEHPEDPIETWYDSLARKWGGVKSFFGSHFGPPPELADTTMNDIKRGFLKTLSEPESGGAYNIKNGGSTFSDFSQFPEGVGPGGTSTASGRYQFTSDTWKEVARKYGLNGFNPENQDKGAWAKASDTYQEKTGRDLESDLRSRNHDADIANALKGVWPSLPGGSQSRRDLSTFSEGLSENTKTGSPAAYSSVVTGPWGARMAGYDAALSNLIRTPTAAATNMNDNSRSVNQNSHVSTGPISIHVANGDADSIARGVGASLRKYAFVSTANVGLA